MPPTASGDPARQLTREDVDRLHTVMQSHEPDWIARTAHLASELESAMMFVPQGRDYEHFRAVVREYHRDIEEWHVASDAYFHALAGPIEEVLPTED